MTLVWNDDIIVGASNTTNGMKIMATKFETQKNLTTQICNFTGETRTDVMVSAFAQARIPGVDTTVSMVIPVLESMLAVQIELFMEENPEFFASDVDSDNENGYTDIFSDPDFAHDSK